MIWLLFFPCVECAMYSNEEFGNFWTTELITLLACSTLRLNLQSMATSTKWQQRQSEQASALEVMDSELSIHDVMSESQIYCPTWHRGLMVMSEQQVAMRNCYLFGQKESLFFCFVPLHCLFKLKSSHVKENWIPHAVAGQIWMVLVVNRLLKIT